MNENPSPMPNETRLESLAALAVFDPGAPVMSLDDLPDATDLDLAAAAAYLAMSHASSAKEPLPEALRARVMTDARRFLAGTPPRPASVLKPSSRAWTILTASGWIAAAASLFLAFWAWKPEPVVPPLTVAQEMQQLSRLYRPITLSATEHPWPLGPAASLSGAATASGAF